MTKLYRNITTKKIQQAPITLHETVIDKDGKTVNVTTITTDEKKILAAGYEVFTPPKAKPADSNDNKLK